LRFFFLEGDCMQDDDKNPSVHKVFSPNFTMSNRGGHGRGYGHGGGEQGRGRGRGRPMVSYPIDLGRTVDSQQGVLELTSFEIKLLELADIEQVDGKNLSQEEIAERLKISQTSVWRYLKALRKKIAIAILDHNEIHINIIHKKD
jgi:predicted DNA-binding protein (UPF0251 family)